MRSTRSPDSAKRATIYDVAAEAGVSKSLVSKVINNDPTVTPARRAAVEAAMKRLNFSPNSTARLLSTGRSRTIGMLVSNYDNTINVRVLAGIREVLDEAGYRISMMDTHQSSHGEDPLVTFASMQIDGVIYVTAPHGVDLSASLAPSVLIGVKDQAGIVGDEIFSDDYLGTELLLEHLWSQGHRQVVHLTGAGEIAEKRRNAYVELTSSRGFEPQVFGLGMPTDPDGGYAGARELLESGVSFTAVYAANDGMATGARTALLEAGLACPADVSIVGYDNNPFSSPSVGNLTTIDDRAYDIGRLAAERLLLHIDDPDSWKPEQQYLEPRLIIRSSTRNISS